VSINVKNDWKFNAYGLIVLVTALVYSKTGAATKKNASTNPYCKTKE
jgi:hypothetical protein